MKWKCAIQGGLLVVCLVWLSGCSKAGENWLRLLGDPAEDVAEAVAIDEGGSVYLAGFTSGNRAGSQAAGGADIVVAKYSPSGDLDWERRWNGPKAEYARSIALTKEAIFVAGYSSAPLESDPNKKTQQVLLLKLNLDGDIEWTREYGEQSDINSNSLQESAEAVTVGADGSVYLAGYTMNSFGKELSDNFDTDVFLLKMDANGGLIDQMLYSTPRSEAANAIAVVGDAIYLAGETAGSLGADEGQTNPQEGLGDAFVMRVAPEGTWTRLLGTTGQDSATGLAVDTAGNVWIAGTVSQGLPGVEPFGSTDGFIAAYDAAGTLRWKSLVGGASLDQVNGIALDEENESVFVTGMTWSDLSQPTSMENNGQGNVFVARYQSSTGTFGRHVQQTTPQQTDWGKAIAFGPFGVAVAGFAGGALEQETHGGSNDILLWKIKPETLE